MNLASKATCLSIDIAIEKIRVRVNHEKDREGKLKGVLIN